MNLEKELPLRHAKSFNVFPKKVTSEGQRMNAKWSILYIILLKTSRRIVEELNLFFLH